MKKNTGFTLIELMIALAILGILLAVGLPSLKSFMQSSQTVASTNELIAAFNVARSEAIKRNISVTICESTNGKACAGSGSDNWQDGWVMFVDSNTDQKGTKVKCTDSNIGTDCLLVTRESFGDDLLGISGVDINTSAVISSTTFNSRGLPKSNSGASQAGNFSICSLDTSGNTINSRAVVLSLTGRVRASDNAAVITCP